jgi:hypothetical protein
MHCELHVAYPSAEFTEATVRWCCGPLVSRGVLVICRRCLVSSVRVRSVRSGCWSNEHSRYSSPRVIETIFAGVVRIFLLSVWCYVSCYRIVVVSTTLQYFYTVVNSSHFTGNVCVLKVWLCVWFLKQTRNVYGDLTDSSVKVTLVFGTFTVICQHVETSEGKGMPNLTETVRPAKFRTSMWLPSYQYLALIHVVSVKAEVMYFLY